MPVEFELNLQDLAKIALGAPELTQVNIAVLHSLIEILLKKLNCQNETVSLSAFDAKNLEKILATAKISPMPFNDENIEIITQRLERLDKLEKTVINLNEKVDGHLEEVRRESNVKETMFDWETLSNYGCEDLCTTCDAGNEMACKLIKNKDFLKKLLRRIALPIVDRMFCLEEKIEKFTVEFNEFVRRAEEEHFKIKLLEKCIIEIENLRQLLADQNVQFLNAMEEIQDMLDTKLDKIHMPALKKYIRDNFHRIDQSLNDLQNKQQCPRAGGIIMENIRCSACGNVDVCSEVGVQAASMLPDMKAKTKKMPTICRRSCDANRVIKGPKKLKLQTLNLSDHVKMKRPKCPRRTGKEGQAPKCRSAGEDFELLEGFDGNLYRKG